MGSAGKSSRGSRSPVRVAVGVPEPVVAPGCRLDSAGALIAGAVGEGAPVAGMFPVGRLVAGVLEAGAPVAGEFVTAGEPIPVVVLLVAGAFVLSGC